MARQKPERIKVEKGLTKITRRYDDRPDVVTFQIRYGDGSGGMASETFSSVSKARAALAKARTRVMDGDYIDPTLADAKFLTVAREWLDSHPDWKATTEKTNEWIVNTKLAPLHGKRMRQFNKATVLAFRTQLMKTLKSNGERPALNSIRRTMAVLFSICEHARITGALLTNPCADLPKFKVPKSQVNIPSHEEVEDLIDLLSRPTPAHQDSWGRNIKERPADPRWAAAVATSAYAGLRAGEICGLRVSDFDPAARTLTIARSVPTNTVVASTPKSDAGVRQLTDLPRTLCARLAVLAESKHRSEYLFGCVDEAGVSRPLRHMNFYRRYFVPACERLGLDIRFHDLRHWHASILIDLGYSPVEVAYRLGHGSASFTLNTYAHLFKKHPSGLGDALDAARSEVRGETSKVVQLSKRPF